MLRELPPQQAREFWVLPLPVRAQVWALHFAAIWWAVPSLMRGADLDDDMQKTEENVNRFAELIADRIGHHKLLPFDEAAVRRVIEQRAR